MLQDIRDRLSGPIVWVVVGLISVPFAFFGIETFNSGGGDPTVVKVGGEKITDSQVQSAYESRVRQYQEMLGENFRMDMINPAQVREGVVNELVQETLLREHASNGGYSASNAAILKTLETIPSFQKDGRFDKATYAEALSRQGMSATGFERQLRDGMAQDQVRDAVLSSAFITPAESAAAWRLSQQERTYSAVSYKPSAFEAGISISDDEVAKYFAANASKYNAKERMKASYVELSLEALPEAAAPDAAKLKALYDADVASFSSPEERRAAHILVNIGADTAAAKQKAEGIKARLDAGADFAALAKEVSDDSGSKDTGGDLGQVRKGQMTPKFEDALFAMKASGEVSAPVETEFGYHLIKLTELKAATVRPFDDPTVQAQLLAAYRKKDAELRFKDLSEKLEQLAFENSSSLDPVAKGVGGTVQTTDWFARGQGPGMTGNAEFQQAAFAPEVIKSGENSKPVSLGATRLVVLRKAEYEAARPLKLEEVREAVRLELASQQAKAKAVAAADALLKALQAPGAVFSDITTAQGLVVSNSGSVKRKADGVDSELLKALFKLPRPSASGISYGKATLSGGDIAVIALASVRDGVAAPADADFVRESGQAKDAMAGVEFAGFKGMIEKAIGVSKKAAAKAADPAAETANP